MDTLDEYIFLKQNTCIELYRKIQYASFSILAFYMCIVVYNYKFFFVKNEILSNFGGIFVYGVLCIQTTSLYEYAKSKLQDFKDEIEYKK